ncbi:hypothetical protein GCM10020219_099130 [Nonomuraea dietziae]
MVQNAHAVLADRAERQLRPDGHAELAHQDDVERRPDGVGHLEGDRDAAAGKTEDDDVLTGQRAQFLSETPSRFAAIGEHRRASCSRERR